MLPTLRARALGAPPCATPAAAASTADLAPRLALVATLAGHRGCVNAVDWLDGDALVTGSDDRTVRVWRASTGRETVKIQTGHTNNVFQARFVRGAGGGCTLVTCAADGQVMQEEREEGERWRRRRREGEGD